MSDCVGGSLYNGMRRRVNELRCGLSELRTIEPKCAIIRYIQHQSSISLALKPNDDHKVDLPIYAVS